jgi:hypothetical protein
MNQDNFTRSDVREALEVADAVVGRAVEELGRRSVEASRALTGSLSHIDTARQAFAADDPKRAAESLADATRGVKESRAALIPPADQTPGPKGNLALDLLDQAASAIDRATHRMRNTISSHSTFGAIRTPHSERLP